MIWFIIHNFLKRYGSMENQTRNLTTFLIGTILYVLFYSYVGSLDLTKNKFIQLFFNFFIYIVLADGFAMAIIYKNFYKHTIFNEVKETFGSKYVDEYNPLLDKPIKLKRPNIPKQEQEQESEEQDQEPDKFLKLEETPDHDETSNQGFSKDSAYGDVYTTNGVSNI